MSIPAGAPFCKYIDDSILTPLISRLDFMLLDDHYHSSDPDRSSNTDHLFDDDIIGKLQELRDRFGEMGKEELSLLQHFDPVEKCIDSIFESMVAGRIPRREIRRKLRTLRKEVVAIRDAVVKPHMPGEEFAGGGKDNEGGSEDIPEDRKAPASGQIRVIPIRAGDVLVQAVKGMQKTLQTCLLTMTAFPENAVIKKRLLIHWWIGEKLVANADVGKFCFHQLLEMRFFRVIRREHCDKAHLCTVHPWIHRMLVDIARRSAFMEFDDLDDEPTTNFETTRRACLRKGKRTLPAGSRFHFHPKVSSIYNIDHKYVKLSAEWFVKKTCLGTLQLGQWRVFDQSNKAADAKKFHVELIHNEHLKGIWACRNLRYLSLRGISRISAIPDAVGDLRELIVLDLTACYNLQTLTRKITKLHKLQYLDVSECYLLVEMPEGLGKMFQLQILKGFVVASSGRKNACRLSELPDLKNLRKLSICIGKKVMKGRQDQLNELAKLGKLKSLRITWGVTSAEGDMPKADGIKFSLPSTLVKLDLQCFPSKKFGQLITPEGLSVLRNLQKLYVTGGKLDSLEPLSEGGDMRVKILRLRFLKHLQNDDCDKLRAKYTEMKITLSSWEKNQSIIKPPVSSQERDDMSYVAERAVQVGNDNNAATEGNVTEETEGSITITSLTEPAAEAVNDNVAAEGNMKEGNDPPKDNNTEYQIRHVGRTKMSNSSPGTQATHEKDDVLKQEHALDHPIDAELDTKKGTKEEEAIGPMNQIPPNGVEVKQPTKADALGKGIITRAEMSTHPSEGKRKEEVPIDKAMKVREIIINNEDLHSVCLVKADEICAATGKDIADSFADQKEAESVFVKFFIKCLIHDEQQLAPESAGHRLYLPWDLSEVISSMEHHNTQYNKEKALEILMCNIEDPNAVRCAKLVFLPVLHQHHWVVYCINMMHSRIDILDSLANWKHEHTPHVERHGNIARGIVEKLHDLFQGFVTGGTFTDFSAWNVAFVDVPNQVLQNDCAFFTMKFLEFYDGNAQLSTLIEPLMGSQYRAQYLYYMLFHPINRVERPLPGGLEELRPHGTHLVPNSS